MSFVSTGNKSGSNGGPAITTPPIAGESSAVSAGSAATDVADAAEQMAEQAAADLFGALPEPSGLVKAAVAGPPLRRQGSRIWLAQFRMRWRRLQPVDRGRITSL